MRTRLLIAITAFPAFIAGCDNVACDLSLIDSGKAGAAEVFRSCSRKAQNGDALAQNTLGIMYASGQGTVQNYAEAAKWYRKAAEQGNATAQNNLGNKYYNGQGVEQNYSEAVKWYRKAADQGNAKAQNQLG